MDDLASYFGDDVSAPIRAIDFNPAKALGMRPYQGDGIVAVQQGWLEPGINTQLLCMATGLGKTPVMSALARMEIDKGGRVLVLAHTDELIDQALDKITKFGQLKAAKEKANNWAGRYARCVVGSVQTMAGDLRLGCWPKNHFTLVMVDEAHRSLAASYQKILNKFLSGGARVLGVTATADRGDKRSLGEFYKKIAFDYGLLQGVRDGWLIRPLVKTMPLELDLRGVKSKNTTQGNDLDQSEVAQRLIPFLGAIAKQVCEARPNGVRMFFLPSVETARLMSDALNAIGSRSEWISGDREERRQIVADFKKGRYQNICNMAVLTEGFDHDKVDTIIPLRPTKIRSLYVQIVGRACRPLNEIVPLLGKAHNAAERHEIIKASAKPAYRILDFLWLYEKHNLTTPASLVTEREDVATEMKKEKPAGEEIDLVDAEEQAERDVLAALEKAVRRNENKKASEIDPLSMGAELGDLNLADYVPETANDALPPTPGLLKILKGNDIDTAKVRNRGHALALVNCIVERHRQGLASVRQLNFLSELGIDARHMKIEEARTIMETKMRAGEFAKSKQPEPAIMEVDGL